MSKGRSREALLAADPVAARSPLMVAFFARIMAQAMARDFHAVRISGDMPELPTGRPAVIYANHPSWWDPALFAVLTQRGFAGRQGYGPIDVEALVQYRFMSRIGLFGIEADSAAGGRRFLRTSLHILADPRSLLWITPEGRFVDPRQRPVLLRPGLAHLARRAPHAIFVPVAIEYVFWTERQPEALCRFGRIVDPQTQAGDVPAWSALLKERLTEAMDELAADAIARDPLRFRILLSGRSGIGGVYDLWRRARAILRHERFSPEHGRF